MAVRIVSFATDGGVQVEHDGHTGPVPVALLRFGTGADGTPTPDALEVPCPVCAAVSYVPISGGHDPGRVQLLFARLYLRRAVALSIPVNQRGWLAIRARIQARVEQMDGPGRFRLSRMASEDDALDET